MLSEGDDKQTKPYKETRRDSREREKHMKWVDKVTEASGMDFEETTNKNLSPTEMTEALHQMQTELRPNTRPEKLKGGKEKYKIN